MTLELGGVGQWRMETGGEQTRGPQQDIQGDEMAGKCGEQAPMASKVLDCNDACPLPDLPQQAVFPPCDPRPAQLLHPQDIAAVRDAMVSAAGEAWGGLRAATVDVFDYQYGEQAAATVQDSCDVVEGIANMG